MDENRRKLYDQLSQNWNVGSWEEFDRDIDNEDNMRVAWDAVGGQDGYGDFDLFKQSIQRNPQQVEQPQQEVQQPAQQDIQTQVPTDVPKVEISPAVEVTPEEKQDVPPVDAAEEKPKADEQNTEVVETQQGQPATTETSPVDNVPTQPAGEQEPQFPSMSDKELLDFMGVGENFTQDDLDNRIAWAYQISDPVVRENRLAQMQTALGELSRRKAANEVSSVAASAVVPKQPAVDSASELQREINEGVDKEYRRLTAPDKWGKSTLDRALSNPYMFDLFCKTIEKIRDLTNGELYDMLKFTLNDRISPDSVKNDAEAAAVSSAVVLEMNARTNGGHAKSPIEDDIENWFKTTKFVIGGDDFLGDARGTLYEANIRKEMELYRAGAAGHASDYKNNPSGAETDLPMRAIPRMFVNSIIADVGKELLELGPVVGNITAPLEALDWQKHLDKAIDAFGRERLMGYTLDYARRNSISVQQAEYEVMQYIKNNIVNEADLSPHNNVDYILSYVLNNNFVTTAMHALFGVTHDNSDQSWNAFNVMQNVLAAYEKSHDSTLWDKASQVVAPAITLVADMKTGGFLLASKASKIATKLPWLYAGSEAGMRSLQGTYLYRLVTGALAGSANFATYEVQAQLLHNLATGNYITQDLWDKFWQGGLKGAAFGIAGESVGTLFRHSNGWKVYVGEGAKAVAEAGVFTGVGYVEARSQGKDFTLKDVGTNIGMVLAGRLAHPVQYCKDVYARANSTGHYGKKVNYHKISEQEARELYDKNYKRISEALLGHRLKESDLPYLEKELELLRQDKTVSWETVRCADWVLNGRLNPAVPPVKLIDIGEDADGYYVTALDANGRAVAGTFRTKDINKYNAAVASVEHEIELNDWRDREHARREAENSRNLADSVKQYAQQTGEDADALMQLYNDAKAKQSTNEKLGEVEGKVLAAVDAILDNYSLTEVENTKKAIGDRFGVDIDKAMQKRPEVRNQQEQDALQRYGEWLDSKEELIDLREQKTQGEVPSVPEEVVSTTEQPSVEPTDVEESKAEVEPEEVVEPKEPEKVEQIETEEPGQEPEPPTDDTPTDTPPTGGEPIVEGESESIGEPLEVGANELPIVEAENLAGGKAVDTHDIEQLWPNDFGGLTEEDLPTYLELAEESRKQAHDYADGKPVEKPREDLWEYWAERDGLVEPKAEVEQPPVEQPKQPTEVPVETPVETPVEQEPTAEQPVQPTEQEPSATPTEAAPETTATVEPTPEAKPEVEATEQTNAEEQRRNAEEVAKKRAQAADPYYMPMENKGGGRMSPDYDKASAEQIFNHLNDRENREQRGTLSADIEKRLKDAQTRLASIEKQEPKGKNRTTSALNAWERRRDAAADRVEKWKEIKRMHDENQRTNGKSDLDDRQAREVFFAADPAEGGSLRDYVMRQLYGMKFKWKGTNYERSGGRTSGLGGHLGLEDSEKERRGFFGWLDEKNGMTPEEAAHSIWESMPQEWSDRYDTMEILDEVLSVVGDFPRPMDMVRNFAKNHRSMADEQADWDAGQMGYKDAAEAEADMEQQERDMASRHDAQAAENAANEETADSLAELQQIANDPNRSEFEHQAARSALRWRKLPQKARERIGKVLPRLKKWRNRLGGTAFKVYYSLDEVKDKKVREQIEKGIKSGKRAPGWFDSDTNTAHIYLPDVRGARDLDETIIHEVVSHKGIRGLFENGAKDGFDAYDDLCRAVWENMSNGERAYFMEYPGVDSDPLKAADEFIAHTMEGRRVASRVGELMNTISYHVQKWLRDHGIAIEINDTDLEHLLRESYKNLREKAGEAGDVAGGTSDHRTSGGIRLSQKEEDKKTTASEGGDAVSGNPSSDSLRQGGSEHLSHNALTHQEDAAKVQQNTEITLRAAKKIRNEGGLRKKISTASQAVSAIGQGLHLEKSDSSQSYYGDIYEGDIMVDGQLLHLRVSDHPATGERMGNADADHKVSLVIRKDGEHKDRGPHNGYTEWIWEPSEVPPKDAANAIVKGVENLIRNGEFVDETGKGHPQDYPYTDEQGVLHFRYKDDERKPTFYSNAERAVEGVKQEKATGEQWKAMLTKAGGIKAGEDKWMGLSEWLDEHKGDRLTKDDVLQFVRDNGVEMREVGYNTGGVFTKNSLINLQSEIKRSLAEGGTVEDALREWDDAFGDFMQEMYKKGEFSVDEEGNITPKEEPQHPIDSVRMNYTTRGLDNKREIAFVVPGVEPYQKNDAVHFGPENEGRAVMWVRFGETTDKDGNRVLVIDEIQSNRHQDAREKGYKGHGSEYERLKQQAQNTQDAYFEQIEEYARTADGRLDRTKLNRAKEDDPLSKALWEQWGKDERALRQYNESHGFSESSAIPAAPFEKQWHEVAMKRMLRLAADEGFDKVAWTTGEQQRARYNLSKVVKSIDVDRTQEPDKYIIWTRNQSGSVIQSASGMMSPERIVELFGKDLGGRILETPEDGQRSISGDGLDIGGAGMKGFYDEMLPRFMNKYGKKWGAKVGEVELSTPGREVMHSVDVTPEMKESVQQGQPLFRIKEKDSDKGYRSLFDDVDERREETPKVSPRVEALRNEISQMRDEDLLRNIGEATSDDKTFYSEEYDRRHMQEYNEACDNYRRMLDEGKVDEQQAEEMLLDAIHDWRDGFSSAERTRLRAQFDTLNDYYAEKEQERWEREDAEERENEERAAAAAQTPAFDPTAIALRPLESGETSYVQRKYERSNQFGFTGTEHIESKADIAYIFKNLENSAIENVFLVLIKDGRPTILHVGMGGYSFSIGHLGSGVLAASELRPDSVVLVHNHPSGTLNPSSQDKQLHEKVVKMFGEGVVESSIIIDTTRGEYSTFDENNDYGVSPIKKSVDGEIPYETYTFSRYAFAPDFNPTKAFQVRSSEDVATFVSSHRLGERKKVSLIVLDRQKRVVGNVFLPWTKLENADIKDVVSEVSRYTHQIGGESCVLYGRIDVSKGVATSIKDALKDRETYLLDFIDVERDSYANAGAMEEGAAYNERPSVADARRRLEDPNASEFEKQAARTVLRAYGGGDTPDGGDNGPRFRIKDETERMEGEVGYKNRQARQRKEAVADFVKATADLDEMTDSKFATALSKVMRGQREYDKDTVKDITDMAKAMMDAGLLSGLDDFAVKQILTKVKDATGKDSVTKEANKLIDIMLKHQLKKGKSEFEQSLKAKGMKQDSRGVVVQGGLDYHGQRMVKSLKEALGLSDLQAVNDRIVEVEQKLNDPDEVVRGNAADELDGLYIARQYFDEIKQNEINEANVKAEMENAKTRHKNGDMSDAAYHQFLWSCEDALRELRCERVDAWSRLNGQLGDSKSESAERAKAFRDEQNRRKEEIQHWANSDLEGVDADPHAKSLKTGGQRRMDNLKHRLQILTNPLATFDKLMRYFGEKFPKGEGNLFNFVRKAVDARDSFFKKRKALYDEMDSAVERIGGLHGQKIDSWHDVYTLVKKLPTLTVNVKGKDYPISQGQATYLVAMDAQTDGRMKLRSMGITEADIDRIRGEIDPMLLDLSDWVVHEFLPSMRGELNQTHIRMFGADMSNIENYFPIRTNELARNETVNLAQQNGKIRPATITGSIIERKRNNADLDITTDFFQTTAEHVSEMEHWNSFAELSRDLNTLLSYKNFRAKVNNMSSLRYGDGKQIWDALEKCCAITTGDYIAEVGSGENIVNAATRKMAQANIALRVYTAAKQLLSSPVYLVQARWDDIIKNIANPMGTWKWAIENLPTFAERWQGRVAGDPILTQSDLESSAAGYKYNKAKEGIDRAGYFSNAAVDAMTVAIGGRSIYETKLRQYKDMGYSEEEANKRALQDAAISVNETQQSGIGTFLSPIQQDRTFWSRMVTLYRNASMGFQRELVGGLTAIKHGLSKTWREEAIRKASTKMIREGIDADVAQRVAERMANREAIRGVAWAAMFGSIAPAVWALGSQYFPYKLAGGSDEDEENEGLLHAAVHLFSGWMEGLVFGQTIGSAAEFGLDYARGKKKFRDFGIDMDLFSESFEQIGQKIDSKKAEAIYDLARMFVSMGVGVDPKTIVDPIVGIMDYFGNDYGAARDFGLLFMRLMNVPQSAVDQTYIDELQMTAGEAQKLPAEELARRWATYKRRKGAGPLNAFTSDEYDAEIEDKYVERFEKMMDARLDLYDGARLDDAMQTTDPFVKKHLVKKITKDAGGTYRKPRSEKDAAYEQYQSKEGMEGDNELKGRLAQLEDYAAAIRKMGAKLKKTGTNKGKWVWTDQKATDYYNAHKKELDAYAAISEFFTDLGAVKDSILTNPDEGKAWIDGVDEQRSKILSETDWVK